MSGGMVLPKGAPFFGATSERSGCISLGGETGVGGGQKSCKLMDGETSRGENKSGHLPPLPAGVLAEKYESEGRTEEAERQKEEAGGEKTRPEQMRLQQNAIEAPGSRKLDRAR